MQSNSSFNEEQVIHVQSHTNLQTPQKNKLEKISFLILLITIILSPLIFITTNYSSIDSIKSETIIFGLLISLLLYSISLFKTKVIFIPKSPLIITGFLVIISTIISTVLSSNIQKSLFGQGFEIYTASFIILMFLTSLLIVQFVYKNKDRVLYIYGSFVFSFIILMFFHIARLFSSSFLSFGVFNSTISTLIGKWTDLGILSGFIFLLSFFAIRTFNLNKKTRLLSFILLIISFFFLLIINSSIIWFIVSLVLITYGISEYIKKEVLGTGIKKILSKIPYITLSLFIISFVLTFYSITIINIL